MKRNNFQFLVSFLILSLIVVAGFCNNEAVETELTVSTENLSFGGNRETKSFHIKTNAPWTITGTETADWCTITPSSGTETGTLKIEVSVTENRENGPRFLTLSIKAGDKTASLMVEQAKEDYLAIEQILFENIPAAGGEITVRINASDLLMVELHNNWLQPTTGAETADFKHVMNIHIAPNPALMEREGGISFSVAGLTETVVIKQNGSDLTIFADKTGMANDAPQLVQQLGIGWNIGNSLEACSATSAGETSWGNPKTTKRLIDAVKAAGFNTVRIPCAWNGYIEDPATCKIKDTWLERVKEVVDYCVDNQMYAILNIHWDGGWLEENPTYAKQSEVNKKQKALWEQIAVYFRDYDEHLLFAGTNEVHAGYGNPTAENIAVQLSYNQTFVNAVRSTGGRNVWRNLVVQAYNTNIDQAVSYLKMPDDNTANRLITEIHYYDPYEFCLDESGNTYLWGKDFSGAGVATWGNEDWADTQFGKMKTHFVDKNIPVILGEYGAALRSSLPAAILENHIQARNYYLNYITKKAIENGVVPVYWDNGNTGNLGSGLFNRTTGEQAHPDAIKAICQ
jgi:endoglucanase